MTYPRIIGLYSSSPQAGKSTIAKYLEDFDYHLVSFAEPLREMPLPLLLNLGYSRAAAKQLLRYDKHLLIPALGVTARHLLRTLGTEWGRDCVHPDIWLKTWRARADRLLLAGHNIVCDDLRFPNEAGLLAAYPQAALWRVHRDTAAPPSEHRSDGGLDDYSGFHAQIHNNRTVLDLYERIDGLLAAGHVH
jgi:hypothetical protein